ncbi:MAG: hypothetical protein AAFR38_04575 [Planctomycetota bacterium]
MDQRKFLTLGVAAAIVSGSAVLVAHAQLGELTPPPGPVADTKGDLETLTGRVEFANQQLMQQLELLTNVSEPIEREIFISPTAGELQEQFPSTLVAAGRIYVESITVRGARATVFDGPGQINVIGNPSSGTLVGKAHESGTDEGRSVTTELGIVVENGLYASWDRVWNTGFVQIRYRVLPPLN